MSKRKKSRHKIAPPTAMANTPSVVSLEKIVEHAYTQLQQQGASSAMDYLHQQLAAMSPSVLAECLTHLASLVQGHNPQAALQLLEKAVAHRPDTMEAWVRLGSLQDRVGQQQAAAHSMLRVVQSTHASHEQKLRAAHLLVRFEHQGIALQAARKAYAALEQPLPFAGAMLYIAQRMADWALMAQLTTQIQQAYARGEIDLPRETPRTHLNWCHDEAINCAVIKQHRQRILPLPAEIATPIPAPLEKRRIRIGYLSSDFREHPTARLIAGLLRHHDRTAFEIVLYCSGWHDGSALRTLVESFADQVHSVTALDNQAAAALIREHKIDVLVELNGPTRANRRGILVYRPAPVQIGYLGWPGSYGGDVVDFIVADDYILPCEREALYPEQIIRLAQTYQVNDYATRTCPPRLERARVGLPEGNQLILGMFNGINKVHGVVWQAWMQILQAVPNALLWLLDPGAAPQTQIAQATQACGVDLNRIILAPHCPQDEHLARLQCCDLILDPWPYGGHTSTSDALFAGVPVVALVGSNFASRVSGSLLRAAGLENFVQPDVEAYIRFTVNLLRDTAALTRVRQFLATQVATSDLFDAASKTRQLEQAYQQAVKWRIHNEPMRHIQGSRQPCQQVTLEQMEPIVRHNTQIPQGTPDVDDADRINTTDQLAKPSITFITACKQRLHHLQQTLPTMLAAQPDAMIVVDYGCPQGTKQWVNAHYPQVKIVSVDDDPEFCLARALNLGAAQAHTDWLVFINADIRVQPDWLVWQRPRLDTSCFYRAGHEDNGKRDNEKWGTFICYRPHFALIGGYDEAFRDWGGEDLDIYKRLVLAGVNQAHYPPHFIDPIRHQDDERLLYSKLKNIQFQLIAHRYYIAAKLSCMAALQPGKRPILQPDLPTRLQMMHSIREAVISIAEDPSRPLPAFSFTVDTTNPFLGQLKLHLQATFQLNVIAPTAHTQKPAQSVIPFQLAPRPTPVPPVPASAPVSALPTHTTSEPAPNPVLVLDPALDARAGHHQMLDAALYRYAQAQGWKWQFLAHHKAQVDFAVIPCFRGGAYVSTHNWQPRTLKMATLFAMDLQQQVNAQIASLPNHLSVLLPTTTLPLLLGLVQWLERLPDTLHLSRIGCHFHTPPDFGLPGTPMAAIWSRDAMERLTHLITARNIPTPLFTVEHPALVEPWLAAGLPHAVVAIAPSALIAAQRQRPIDERLRLLFIGTPREEKGINELIRALPTLLHALPRLDLRLVLTIEANKPREVFQSLASERVQIRLENNLPAVDFYQEIADADAVYCAYQPAVYAQMSSKIFQEAQALGVPALVTAGTGAAQELQQTAGQGAVVVPNLTRDALVEGCRELMERIAILREEARQLSSHYTNKKTGQFWLDAHTRTTKVIDATGSHHMPRFAAVIDGRLCWPRQHADWTITHAYNIAVERQAVIQTGEVLQCLRAHPHPHIAHIDDYDQDFVYMEYIDGTVLLNTDPSCPPQHKTCAVQEGISIDLTGLESAIKHLHDLGIAHTDIAGHNIMVTHAGTIKLIDLLGCVPLTPQLQKLDQQHLKRLQEQLANA